MLVAVVTLIVLVAAARFLLYFARQRQRNIRLTRPLFDPSPDRRRAAVERIFSGEWWAHGADLVHLVNRESDEAVLDLVSKRVLEHSPPTWSTRTTWLARWAQARTDGKPIERPTRAEPHLASPERGRLGDKVRDAVLVAGLSALVLVIGVLAHAYGSFPTGYDAWGHLSDTNLVLRNFPHLLWNAAWYSGTPGFPGRYGPGYTWAVALLQATTGIGIARSMVVIAAAINLTIVLSLYWFVRSIVRNRIAAVGAALLFAILPALWAQTLMNGLYPRLSAFAFYAVASALAAGYSRRGGRVRAGGISVALAAALLCHPVVGAIGFIQVAMLLLILPEAGRKRLARTAGILAMTLGLVAFFYIPYAIRPHKSWLPGLVSPFIKIVPISWERLFTVGTVPLAGFIPVFVPIVLVLAASLVLALTRFPHRHVAKHWDPLRERRRVLGPVSRAALATGLCAAGLLAWTLSGNLLHARFDVQGIASIDMIIYGAWPLAALGGLAAGGVGSLLRRPYRLFPGLTLLVAGLASIPSSFGIISSTRVHKNGPVQHQLIAMVPKAGGSSQSRIGGMSDSVTEWLNAVTTAPQNRGYFAQDILQTNNQAWMEDVLQSSKYSPSVRSFIVSWYSLGSVFTNPGTAGPYIQAPRKYQLEASGAGGYDFRLYRVVHPTPVLQATRAPAVLAVGNAQHYLYVLRTLSQAGLTSSAAIPVEGSANLNTYTLAELRKFSAVILYGATTTNPARADSLLSAYVRGGGHLVLDLTDDPELLYQLIQADPSLFPEHKAYQIPLNGTWGFVPSRATQLSGVDVSAFCPPRYGSSSPWNVVLGRPTAGSTTVLGVQQASLVTTRTYGHGTVAISGMNLPYHAAVYANGAESRLLVNLLELPPSAAVNGTRAVIANADSALVSVPAAHTSTRSPVRGVLFHENDYVDWHATVNGKAARIWPAGPGMMYVQVPGGSRAVVRLFYKLSALQLVSCLFTALSIAGVAVFISWDRLGWIRRRTRGLLTKFDLM